ncbi:hypothetical protein [Rhizobium lusitanum]|uniref:hypothetical protein n=1 Tax=Rhizobium lusitanum TaxID=293958 RepID=UPI001957EFBE|nr:hypothetical protein [Rhizobium lusitanum]MBM7047584.1 hypothetical protein [Rhizobium lusitanum]
MPSTFTPNLNLELQATGEDINFWGQNLNNNVFTLLDGILGGAINISLSNTDIALTTDQCSNNIIQFTGTLTANVTVSFPQIGRNFFIINGCTGAFTLTLQTTYSGSNTIVIPQGVPAFVVTFGVGLRSAPNVFGAPSSTPGNIAVFGDSTGKSLADEGIPAPVIASQSVAEAGVSNTTYMSPLRTAQQVTARLASSGQAQAGTDNSALMTPLRTAQAIQAQASSYPSSSTDPNNLNQPIGATVAVQGILNRNTPCNVYLSPSDATAYQISPGGAMLVGTWLARGKIGTSTMMVQRVS